jgi:hypothetical protein
LIGRGIWIDFTMTELPAEAGETFFSVWLKRRERSPNWPTGNHLPGVQMKIGLGRTRKRGEFTEGRKYQFRDSLSEKARDAIP